MFFIFTCPFCKQQFSTSDEMVGQSLNCSNCGNIFTVQKQMQPLVQRHPDTNMPMMILGIMGLILWLIPLFGLPIPIIGFIMSCNRNYRLGIILNSIGMALAILWTIVCVVTEIE